MEAYKCSKCKEVISESEFIWSGMCKDCYDKNWYENFKGVLGEIILELNKED